MGADCPGGRGGGTRHSEGGELVTFGNIGILRRSPVTGSYLRIHIVLIPRNLSTVYLSGLEGLRDLGCRRNQP